ncbi:MAG: hypothetical protein OSJ43_06245 [Oscillospiraceae bacterium]|nr:hypothetical protein [Oscillospiraceae bacterium]
MITVYSTNPPCPKCKVLKKKLDEAGIEYTVVDDVDKIIEKGYGNRYMPLVENDGQIMDFAASIKFVNEKGR